MATAILLKTFRTLVYNPSKWGTISTITLQTIRISSVNNVDIMPPSFLLL